MNYSISIHALREEATGKKGFGGYHYDISIHALRRGGRRYCNYGKGKFGEISIHALREERPAPPLRLRSGLGISIHALREEGDKALQARFPAGYDFYPRPPRGGRLVCAFVQQRAIRYFYPRPPRGGRLLRSFR